MFFFPVDFTFGPNVKTEPLTREQLAQLRAQRLKDGLCPECGHEGDWRPPASLVCSAHGPYAGC